MTVAVSRAKGAGAEAIICASTGNTAASCAAYAARADLRGAVIVPEGRIAIGKLAQALMHGARVIALRGNFDQALEIVRELAEAPPRRAGQLGQPVPDRGPEDGRRSRSATSSRAPPTRSRYRSATPATSPPGGVAFASTRQRPCCTASRLRARRHSCLGKPVPEPETIASAIRIGNPARWEEAMDAVTGFTREDRGGLRPADPRRLPPARLARGRLLRAGLGRVGRRDPRPRPAHSRRRRAARRSVVCVLTGHGLKDPDTALGKAPSVIGCEAEIGAVERPCSATTDAAAARPASRSTSGPARARFLQARRWPSRMEEAMNAQLLADAVLGAAPWSRSGSASDL